MKFIVRIKPGCYLGESWRLVAKHEAKVSWPDEQEMAERMARAFHGLGKDRIEMVTL